MHLIPAVLLAAAAFVSTDAHLKTLSGTIEGTLLAPPEGRAPLVLIIAGSGPTDRDGNSKLIRGQNNSLKLLAEGLAANGIASLRYDKRGIAASAAAGPSEADLRFDTYIDDAAAWCTRMKNDKRFSAVYILGHSEGSLIGMNAAAKCGAAGFVSIAGAGRPAGEILRAQLAGKLPPDLAAASDAILKGLEEGKTAADVPPALNLLYRPSVQPYIISWLKHDPASDLAKLKVPVLVIQGTTDIQVSVEDAKRLAAADPKAKLLLVEGMNHVLKKSTDLSSYGDPSLPLAAEVVPAIVDLVRK